MQTLWVSKRRKSGELMGKITPGRETGRASRTCPTARGARPAARGLGQVKARAAGPPPPGKRIYVHRFTSELRIYILRIFTLARFLPVLLPVPSYREHQVNSVPIPGCPTSLSRLIGVSWINARARARASQLIVL